MQVARRIASFAFRGDVATVRLSGIPLQEVIQACVHESPEGLPGFIARPMGNDNMPLLKHKKGLGASLGGLFDVATHMPRFTDMAAARRAAIVLCVPVGLDEMHRGWMLHVAQRYAQGPAHLRPLLVFLQIGGEPRDLPDIDFDVVNEDAIFPTDGPAVLADLAQHLQQRLDSDAGLSLEDASIGWYEPIPPQLGGVEIRTPPNAGPDGGRTVWHFGRP